MAPVEVLPEWRTKDSSNRLYSVPIMWNIQIEAWYACTLRVSKYRSKSATTSQESSRPAINVGQHGDDGIFQDWYFLINCISSSNACNLSSSIFTKLHEDIHHLDINQQKSSCITLGWRSLPPQHRQDTNWQFERFRTASTRVRVEVF